MTNIRSLVAYIMVGEPIKLTLTAREQKLAQITGILVQSKEKNTPCKLQFDPNNLMHLKTKKRTSN